ncbi:hypothetical protein [Kitasatospora sp. NBC_01266]|uniref:hypothetical protein n=1 Tax=Kitasatospora sp. NBC_01266 TaxID=2903572 RepID=UPI002E365CD7|nr:hypothetical protein [Kitasatospora sp. NBC_01266]
MSQTMTTNTTTATQPVTALTGATAAVYTELCGQQSVTAAALAVAAEVSPSAARKALVSLEQRGLAHRTPGGNDRTRKLPDLWHPATFTHGSADTGSAPERPHGSNAEEQNTSQDAAVSTAAGEPATATAPDGPEAATESGDCSEPNADTPAEQYDQDRDGHAERELRDGTGENGRGVSSTAANEEAELPQGEGSPDGSGDGDVETSQTPPHADTETPFNADTVAASDAGEGADDAELTGDPLTVDASPQEEHASPGTPESDAGESGPAAPTTSTGQPDAAQDEMRRTPDSDGAPGEHICVCTTCGTHMAPRPRKRPVTPTTGGSRLAPGQLHQLVLEHLRANPEQDWTPTKVSQALGRSSGAIANALDTMVSRGEAVMTNDKPRRFQAAPSGTSEAPSTE